MLTQIWINIGSGNHLLPNHYLNQCWITISKVQWDIHLGAISHAITRSSIQLAFRSPRGQCFNFLDHKEDTQLENVPWYATIIDKAPSTSSTSYEICTRFYFGLISPWHKFGGFIGLIYAYFNWRWQIICLFHYQYNSPNEYGNTRQHQITTKHNNGQSAYMFCGMYCTFELHSLPSSNTKHQQMKGNSLPTSKLAQGVCGLTSQNDIYNYSQVFIYAIYVIFVIMWQPGDTS